MKLNLLDNDTLGWQVYGADTRFSYPIGYSGALLGYDGQGHIDLVYCWEPGKYCHFHRHLCEVRSTVLQGSLEVVTFKDGEAVSTVTRQAGSYSQMPEGDVHMERGGPEGATVLFNLYAPHGQLTEMLDEAGNTLKTITIESVLTQFSS
ncbi:MAG: hypothetical protein ACR2PD_05865 [Luminiphilus sp.]